MLARLTSHKASTADALQPPALPRLVLPLDACASCMPVANELGQNHVEPGAAAAASAHTAPAVMHATPEYPLATVPQEFTLPDSHVAREVKHGWPDALSIVYGAPSASASGDRGQ